MKGKLGYDKWSISDMGGHSYLAERIVNGDLQSVDLRSHCLACAKSDILAKYGGQVDTRGWQNQGTCGIFLKAMSLTTKSKVHSASEKELNNGEKD